jgi:hypothetical protein
MSGIDPEATGRPEGPAFQEAFQMRSLTERSRWVTFHREYYRDLGRLMEDLQGYQSQVEAALPPDVGEAFRSADYPDASRLCKRRNAALHSIVVFAAMACEATVNYFGARRFGGEVFEEYFERMAWIPKVKTMVLLGAGVRVRKKHPLLRAAQRISEMRGELVHPKAKELPWDPPTDYHRGPPVIETAKAAIDACNAFLDEFTKFVPEGSGIDPREH